MADLKITQELEKKIIELSDFIKQLCLDTLNEDERYLYEHYKEHIAPQDDVRLGCLLHLNNWWKFESGINDKTGINIHNIFNISCEYPILVTNRWWSGEDAEYSERLTRRKENKKRYKELKAKIKRVNDIVNEINAKFDSLDNLFANITKIQLRKLSPKIYNKYYYAK